MGKKIEVTMDESGRICIPKEIRKQLGLKPGVKITVEADVKGDAVALRPSREKPRLVNKDGVLIHRWDVFDDWLEEEFDEYEVIRDEDGEVRALYDEAYGKVIDIMIGILIKWDFACTDSIFRMAEKVGIPLRTHCLILLSLVASVLQESHAISRERALPCLGMAQRKADTWRSCRKPYHAHCGVVQRNVVAEFVTSMNRRPRFRSVHTMEIISKQDNVPFFEIVPVFLRVPSISDSA